eukprot:5214844-Prymnesium_polylepis.1
MGRSASFLGAVPTKASIGRFQPGGSGWFAVYRASRVTMLSGRFRAIGARFIGRRLGYSAYTTRHNGVMAEAQGQRGHRRAPEGGGGVAIPRRHSGGRGSGGTAHTGAAGSKSEDTSDSDNLGCTSRTGRTHTRSETDKTKRTKRSLTMSLTTERGRARVHAVRHKGKTEGWHDARGQPRIQQMRPSHQAPDTVT